MHTSRGHGLDGSGHVLLSECRRRTSHGSAQVIQTVTHRAQPRLVVPPIHSDTPRGALDCRGSSRQGHHRSAPQQPDQSRRVIARQPPIAWGGLSGGLSSPNRSRDVQPNASACSPQCAKKRRASSTACCQSATSTCSGQRRSNAWNVRQKRFKRPKLSERLWTTCSATTDWGLSSLLSLLSQVLAVQSRSEVGWIVSELPRLVCPSFADVLVGSEPPQVLRRLAKL